MNTIEGKIGKEAQEFLKDSNKVSLLATIDNNGCPHLEFISFFRAFGDDRIVLNRFCKPGNRHFFEERPEAAFLVLSSDMRWLRGSMHYTHYVEAGGVFDAKGNNTLLGFNREYSFDLISIEEIRKLQMRKIFLGRAMSRVKAIIAPAVARGVLTGKEWLLLSDIRAFKFLCWKEEGNLSDIVPIVQAVPAGADRIVFSSMPHGEDFADARIGAKAAIICLNGKSGCVLAKGRLISKGVLEIESLTVEKNNEHCAT